MNDREFPMIRIRSSLQACALALFMLGIAATLADAAEVTFVLAISNGKVPANMRLIRVKQNDAVKLQWSTDKPVQIHLHGYDIERDLKPGVVTEMAFTARATGRFTLASHTDAAAGGGHSHGDMLVTIEVYP
jgi:hypothetical protein